MTATENNDNIVSHLSRVTLGQGVAAKTGNPYYYVDYVWNLPDGKTYSQRVYLSNEALPLIQMSVSNADIAL